MNSTVFPHPIRCKCGADSRLRYKVPVHWVECRSKKCPYKFKTHLYPDIEEQYDVSAMERAVDEWNKWVNR